MTSQLAAGGEEPLQAALLPEALAASGAEPELAGVLCSIAAACEQISELLRMPQFESPAAGRALNVQGETATGPRGIHYGTFHVVEQLLS